MTRTVLGIARVRMGRVEQPLLVASDVDGTLLTREGWVTPRTSRVVARVVAEDVPFVFVTGRPPRWMASVFNRLGVTSTAVCANGAVLYDGVTDRVLETAAIDVDDLNAACTALSAALPGCSFGVERVVPGVAGRHDVQEFLGEPAFRRSWPNPDCRIRERTELLSAPAVKLLVLHDGMSSDEMSAVAAGVLDEQLRITFSSGSGLIELSCADVDKGTALAGFARGLGVPSQDVIAFGDMPNDDAMLRWVGHGVAMGNAHPSLPPVADEVTLANDEDGVAQVLERWF